MTTASHRSTCNIWRVIFNPINVSLSGWEWDNAVCGGTPDIHTHSWCSGRLVHCALSAPPLYKPSYLAQRPGTSVGQVRPDLLCVSLQQHSTSPGRWTVRGNPKWQDSEHCSYCTNSENIRWVISSSGLTLLFRSCTVAVSQRVTAPGTHGELLDDSKEGTSATEGQKIPVGTLNKNFLGPSHACQYTPLGWLWTSIT